MIIDSFARMMDKARELGPMPVAVAAADELEVLESLVEAQREGIVTPYLVGDQPAIEAIARANNLDLSGMKLFHETDRTEAARRVVTLVREGEAAVVVKGQVKTADLLRCVLDRDTGLRHKSLLSHIALYESPVRDQLFYLTDGGVIPRPTWEQKVQIIHNVIEVAHRFGLEQPKVAILAANERVDPGMPNAAETLMVARLAQEEWADRAIIEGPMALDMALNPTVAQEEGASSAIGGQADIVIVPSVETGNIVGKAILYLAEIKLAALIVGARAPVLINSRADDVLTRFYTLGMAVVWTALGSKSTG